MTLALAIAAFAETPTESSLEVRFQLDLRVPASALATFLPQDFTPNVATQGPAKDCNLRAVFIDRITISAPDGKPAGKGSNRLVYLAARPDQGQQNVYVRQMTAHSSASSSRTRSAVIPGKSSGTSNTATPFFLLIPS